MFLSLKKKKPGTQINKFHFNHFIVKRNLES